MTFQF
jgi:NAD(P)-dependent dehydrogenase (short-subunit alcohol dehydrogenase family)